MAYIILKNKELIKGVTVLTKQILQTVDEVEKLLLIWIDNKVKVFLLVSFVNKQGDCMMFWLKNTLV